MTDKQTEALKLALNALEFNCISSEDGEDLTPSKTKKAITAIREVLAEQPEVWVTPKLRPLAKMAHEQQEPVAWMYQCSADSSGPVLMQHKRDWAESGSGLWTETPLYTSQPASKPLTDEEIKRMAAPLFMSHYWNLCIEFARAIEAKLREKNA